MTRKILIGIIRLIKLKRLNLPGNSFYGKVLLKIGLLKVLECLDLSTDKFSGEIQYLIVLYQLQVLFVTLFGSGSDSGKCRSGMELTSFTPFFFFISYSLFVH